MSVSGPHEAVAGVFAYVVFMVLWVGYSDSAALGRATRSDRGCQVLGGAAKHPSNELPSIFISSSTQFEHRQELVTEETSTAAVVALRDAAVLPRGFVAAGCWLE